MRERWRRARREAQACEGQNTGREPRGYGSPPEVALERGSLRLDDQVRGRQVGAQRHGEHAEQRAERRRPTVGGCRGHRGEADCQGERRDDAGCPKRETPRRSVARRLASMRAKRECRPTQDDANQRDREGHVQVKAQPREGGRKRGEEADDHEDQPDVVGLPNRAHRLGHGPALITRTRAAGQEVPHAAADVRGEREQQDSGDDLGLAHGSARFLPA